MNARRGVMVILVLALTFAGCARSDERPAGVAESWLQEIGNQGRTGTKADAVERAAKLGDQRVAQALIPLHPQPDKRYFSDLEVGRAQVAADGSKAQVPYRLTARVEEQGTAGKVVKAGTLILDRVEGRWRVTRSTAANSALKVPSQGGPLPARAQNYQWITAFLLGIVLTAISVLVIERQPKVAVGSRRTAPGV